MCGIAGIALSDLRQPVDEQRLSGMSASIQHRGPDGHGFFTAPGVGLAHRRLSIIDLEGGSQPLGNEDGSVQTVFNGELYNYRELRHDLEQRGHRFATHSDTEVLVHLYEELGERLVDKLRGMFAFALWDQRRSRLLLARDRVGIKPLYYYRDEEKLLFCSELKGILAYGGVPREIDLESLDDYLTYGMVAGTRTIFRGVHKLAPGHTLVLEPNRWNVAPRQYWRLDFSPDDSLTEADWIERIRTKLDEAVDMHLIADVPLGAFLSGGIDSSAITALAAERSTSPIHTFSIGFQESTFNELPFARQVARRYGTQHIEEIVSPDAVDILDQLCWYYDEPFADTSAIPTMLVSQLASRHVKVVLSGDGGDEAFGGYARYAHDLQEAGVRRWLPPWLRRSFLAPVARLWPQSDWLPRRLRAKSTLTNLSLNDGEAYANTLATCRLPLRRQLLASDVVRELTHYSPSKQVAEAYRRGNGDALSSMISADVATMLPDDYLVKVDRASMAYGLEVRPPLLDHEFLELAARIPSRWKIRKGETKHIFKRAVGDLIPAELQTRPKQGFEIPVDRWMQGPLRDLFRDSVIGSTGPLTSLLNLAQVEQAFEQHARGRRRLGQVLWSLMVLAHWSKQFVENVPTQSSPLTLARV